MSVHSNYGQRMGAKSLPWRLPLCAARANPRRRQAAVWTAGHVGRRGDDDGFCLHRSLDRRGDVGSVGHEVCWCDVRETRSPFGNKPPDFRSMVDEDLSATGSVRWAIARTEQWAASSLSVRHPCLLQRQDTQLAALAVGVPVTYDGRPGARSRRALPASLLKVFREIVQADVVVVSETGFSLPVCYFISRVLRPLVAMAQNVIDNWMTIWVPDEVDG